MAKRITKVGRYRVEHGTALGDVSLKELGRYERRAARTVLREVRNVEPEVLRYARRAMGVTRAQLAQALGVTPETVSRWETGAEAYKPVVPLALATLLDMFEGDGDRAKLQQDVPSEGTITLKAS
jgi:DNA-binding transcriptional regulator YiaG